MTEPTMQRTASSSSNATISQDALDRVEANIQASQAAAISAVREIMDTRFKEHERRIGELNNSHEKAIEAKRLSDEAATRVQERTVTFATLQTWKDEVNRQLAVQAGSAAANAKTWALIMGIVVILINVALRVLNP